MNAETHSQLANFIWSICNLLRGPYKRNEYRKVILPQTLVRAILLNINRIATEKDSVCEADSAQFLNGRFVALDLQESER
jgi:type I restriction-modification system DNA methylase subunit